jgi:chorismate synthase
MKIEHDRAEIVSGVRHSHTIGSPVAISSAIGTGKTGPKRCPWKTWTAPKTSASPSPARAPATPTWPAPSSTISRCALHSGARQRARNHRPRGHRRARQSLADRVRHRYREPRDRRRQRAAGTSRRMGRSRGQRAKTEVLLGCVDAATEARMKEVVDQAYRTGDTVGGVFEVVAHGVPPGLGSHTTWDARLDGRLAQAIVSIQAVKGVEAGIRGGERRQLRLEGAGHHPLRSRGAPFHARRQSRRRPGGRHHQRPGRAGARIPEAHLHAAPAARIGRLATREPALAAYERSDVCVVPAAGVIGGGHGGAGAGTGVSWKSSAAIRSAKRKRNFEGYLTQVRDF